MRGKISTLEIKDKMDQNGTGGEKLITLKQAAELTGYAPDYVGQLIRKGRLYGKQVYRDVVWMTTEKAVQDYINGENSVQKAKTNFLTARVFKILSWALYGVLGILIIFFIYISYVGAVSWDERVTHRTLEKTLQRP